jgi:alkaline phosphatase D
MTPVHLDRRRFLGLGAAGIATLATARLTPAGAQTMPGPQPGAVAASPPFTLGVASGDPTPGGVVLWTRLAPDPLNGGGMGDQPVTVEWEVAEDEAMQRVVARGSEQATSQMGHSVHAEVDGLRPGAWYWYRFKAGSDLSPVGRTRTAPAIGAAIDRLAFALTSCQIYDGGFYTAHRTWQARISTW